jgi:hypothetical protein
MLMNRSRRLFMANTAGYTAALALGGCGGSDYSAPAPVPAPPPPAPAPPGPPAGGLTCNATAITNNHGHALLIPASDTDSLVDKVYNIVGAADHNHLVTLTAAQLAQIKAKTAVTVTSTAGGDGHTHSVTVNCA